ncbi:MAG: hypothetical protein FWC06_01370 [Treponema sp.]|nr:hypothetical protein [Treponema sp.]
MKTLRRIWAEYIKWRNCWDELCKRCGKCCYQRSLSDSRDVVIDYYSPCENYDEKTCLCLVFEERFKKCNHCGSVNLFNVLFNPLLPPECAYAQTFRVWKK